MDKFLALFGSLIRFHYFCFDRIVIHSMLRSLMQPSGAVYFFREVKGVECIEKTTLLKRTYDYTNWVEAYAAKQNIPIDWANKDRKKDALAELRKRRMHQGFTGVYAIYRSKECSQNFRITKPKFETKDPNHRFLTKQFTPHKHYYFYLIDKVLGAFSMRVSTYIPFHCTYYLNGHEIVAQALRKKGISFRMKDNAFVSSENVDALQQAADDISPDVIQERLNYWTFVLGPKFSKPERDAFTLNRSYYIRQIEYATNVVFKRYSMLRSIFERSCDLGLMRLGPSQIADIFGWKFTKRLNGKLQKTLNKLDKGHHVLRAHARHSAVRQYQKFLAFFRFETLSNDLKDFKIKKSLEHLPEVAASFKEVNNRFIAQQVESLNVEPEYPLLESLAQPFKKKSRRIPGIRLDDDRIMRLFETLMLNTTTLKGITIRELHQQVLDRYELKAENYTLNQLRYDLRKLKDRGFVQRVKGTYRYLLSAKGRKVSALMVIIRSRVIQPIAGSILSKKPNQNLKPVGKIQSQLRKTSEEFENLITLLKAG